MIARLFLFKDAMLTMLTMLHGLYKLFLAAGRAVKARKRAQTRPFGSGAAAAGHLGVVFKLKLRP